MQLAGEDIRLRAVEPGDIDAMYRWENDPALWEGDTLHEPLSRHALERFVEEQRYDIFQTRQQRLIIERMKDERTMGCVDLFEVEPLHCRAGVGIVIYPTEERRKGYASEALRLLEGYAQESLRMHQLWCDVAVGNTASRALFRKAGYEEAGRKRDWVWMAEGGYCDTLTLQKIF